jgi:predicted nucleic acid-binding protein
MSVFLDTAIFMYANGSEHPLREPCRVILRDAAEQRLVAVTSAEVIQEILHRYISIRRAAPGIALAREVAAAFRPLLPITHAVAERLPDLVQRYPRLTARDIIHVATCLEEGIDTIVSPDRGFDEVSEIERRDPVEVAGR